MLGATYCGLLKIELPGHTVLLCDGGTVPYAGDSYRERDAVLGVLIDSDEIREGIDEQLPALTMRFAVPDDVAAGDLLDPDWEDCPAQLFLATIGEDGAPIDVEDCGDLVIDTQELRFPDAGPRVLEITFVSVWQRLFSTNEGNVLNGIAHRRVHPEEAGMDNTTGVSRDAPWGTNSVRTGN